MSFYLPEGGMLYYYGFFEANLSNFYINFLKPSDVFLDVGAHVGYYTLLASAITDNRCSVYSFEPTPRTFLTLRENTKLKNNITVENKAILDKKTTIEFFDYGPKYSAFNTFKKRTGKEIFFRENAERIHVETMSLDTYCKDNAIKPTIIKIDAEGSEYLILGAMQNILKNNKPIITIEVSNTDEWENNRIQSIKILTEQDYQCFEITLEGKLIASDPLMIRTYDNLLFVHKDNLIRLQGLMVTRQPSEF